MATKKKKDADRAKLLNSVKKQLPSPELRKIFELFTKMDEDVLLGIIGCEIHELMASATTGIMPRDHHYYSALSSLTSNARRIIEDKTKRGDEVRPNEVLFTLKIEGDPGPPDSPTVDE
jgi:hypothetical protein